MLRLKTISLLGHPGELDTLPEGKLLINTINAHSYNTARKDAAFAEALLKGDALIPDGASSSILFANNLSITKVPFCFTLPSPEGAT